LVVQRSLVVDQPGGILDSSPLHKPYTATIMASQLPDFPDTLPEFPHRGLSTTGGQAYTITTVVFLVLVVVALGLRTWAKIKVGRRFVFHDYAIFLSAVCVSTVSIEHH
jgi:hypothetical protein